MNTTAITSNKSTVVTNILLALIALILIASLITTLSKTAASATNTTVEPTPTLSVSSPAVQQWEYKFVRADNYVEGPFGGYEGSMSEGNTNIGLSGNPVTLKAINELGKEGWELVSVIHNYGETGANLIFKRPVP